MYDFQDDGAGAPASSHEAATQAGKPRLALTALELPRFLGEYSSSLISDSVTVPHRVGEGRPVLVIPGFAANDALTGRVRGHLRRRGFTTYGWGLGRNVGLTDELVTGLGERFDRIHERHGEPVSVVGWSFGGLLARKLAHDHPDAVRQIVCLGSPWRPEGEHTRATAMFERSRLKNGIVEDAREIVDRLRGEVPVRCTAVWSRSDGVVPWRGCAVDDGPLAENVEVPSSHVGLVSNPLALSVVVDRLAQDLDAWQPFSWRRAVTRTWGQAWLPESLTSRIAG